jgi:hypothetical protein
VKLRAFSDWGLPPPDHAVILHELRRLQSPREIDNREETIASFAPFADFNQPSFTVGVAANPLVGVNIAYTRYLFQTGRILGLRVERLE